MSTEAERRMASFSLVLFLLYIKSTKLLRQSFVWRKVYKLLFRICRMSLRLSTFCVFLSDVVNWDWRHFVVLSKKKEQVEMYLE